MVDDAKTTSDTAPIRGRGARRSGRDGFSGRLGFVVACVGSAVGMANMWLFPYRVAELGGAAFLIPYLIFVALLGFTGVIGEMAFGRATGSGPMGAFSKALEMRGVPRGKVLGKVLGAVPTIGSLAIAVGYAVVLGWACRYLFASVTGDLSAADPGAYFGSVAGDFGNVGFHLLGLGITFAVMVFGVSRGIERLNKVLMPVFFTLLLILLVRVAMLPGAMAGYEYLFVPRWEALAEPKTWVYALGQAFFSLSLAGSGTLVYGSYLSKDVDVVASARNVAIFDTLAALVSSMVVVPAVFAFGLDISSGPPLMFITLPAVFAEMPFGAVFEVLFFVAVVCAAVTSLLNLFETPVEALQRNAGLSRGAAVAAIAAVAVGVGLFLENGESVSAWMDAVSIYVIPLGALLAAVMFFWVCPRGYARRQASVGRSKPLGAWFDGMTRYVFVGITAAVVVLGIVLGGIG